jgi:hypothetical protein
MANLFHLRRDSARLLDNPTGGPFVAIGFIVSADSVTESSEFLVTTAQGDLQFRASDIPHGGGLYKLGVRVHVDGFPAVLVPAASMSEVRGHGKAAEQEKAWVGRDLYVPVMNQI